MYEIVETNKTEGQTRKEVLTSLRAARPEMRVEALSETDATWVARLVTKTSSSKRAADAPPAFLKKKDDAKDDLSDSKDEVDDPESDSEDSPDPEDSGDGESSDNGAPKGDPVKQIQKLLNEVQKLFGELKDKADKVDEIHDSIKDHVGPDNMEEGGGPVGPTPGATPPMGGPPGAVPPVPRGPSAPGRFDKRRPGLPSPSGINTFTKRRTEIATHPGTDEMGNRISLTAAAAALESSEEFSEYEVAGMTINADGSYTAKLQLRS